MLNAATIRLFWIPRNLTDLPAFTTNVEFGEFMHSSRTVAGAPEDAVNNRYLKTRFEMIGGKWFTDLSKLCYHANYKVDYELRY